MASFFDDVRTYIMKQGYDNVFCEYKPESPDNIISIFVYSAVPYRDGTSERRTQIQVRHTSTTEAYRIATQLSKILDSGSEETQINLAPDRWCIATPTARPKRMGQDEKKRTTYYFEVSIWSLDKE